jgi:hypothetical protein
MVFITDLIRISPYHQTLYSPLVERHGLEYSKDDDADLTQLRTLAVGGAAAAEDPAYVILRFGLGAVFVDGFTQNHQGSPGALLQAYRWRYPCHSGRPVRCHIPHGLFHYLTPVSNEDAKGLTALGR